jgi:hypothetical protein
VCGTLFALTLVSPFFWGQVFWLVLPFFMVIPFCMGNCYDSTERQRGPHGAPGVSITVAATASPMQEQPMTVHAQPVLVQAQPVMAQPMIAQPVMAQATVVTAVANPVAGMQQPQQPQQSTQQQQQQQQQPPPPPLPPPQYASAPTSFEVETASHAPAAMSLHDFLVECQLVEYEMAMQEMGAIEASDVRDITEEELVAMGMKKLQVRRLHRSLASLS